MKTLIAGMAVLMLCLSGTQGRSYAMDGEEKEETLKGTLEGNLVAIGGETTGWRIRLDDGKSVDVLAQDGKKPSEDKDFLARLQKLDGKMVAAKGKTGTELWVESGPRKYIKVEDIQESSPPKQGKAAAHKDDDTIWVKEGECGANGQHIGTADIGVCGRCGGETNSGSMKICKKCGAALGVCPFCLKKVKDASFKAADGQWIKEGVHDSKDCCEGQSHIKPIRMCERCKKGQTGDGHDLCVTCTKELGICYHCHRKR